MRKDYRIWIVLNAIGIAATGGCTSRDLYETRQQDAHTACLNKTSGVQRDECLRQTSHSYDEYTREREKVQKDTE